MVKKQKEKFDKLEKQTLQLQSDWFDLVHDFRCDVHTLMGIDYDSSTLRQRVKVKDMELQKLDENIHAKITEQENLGNKSNGNGKC